jgi:hypothetical protein
MIRCPRELDGRIDHLLAINSVRIALAIGLPETNGEIVWWRSDWDLRAHSRQRTIPDGLFAIRWPDIGDHVFALEVERGTRAPRSFQTKLLRYVAASYRRGGIYGETEPVVLVVGRSSTWLARYRAALAPLPIPINIGFTVLDDIERLGAPGPVWQARTDHQRYSLRTLATLPYRKEPLPSEFGANSNVYASRDAHIYPI